MQEGCNLNSQALWDLLVSSQMQRRMLILKSPRCAGLWARPSRSTWMASWAAAAGITPGRVRPWMQLTKHSQCKTVISQGDGLEQGWMMRELLMARDYSAHLVEPSPPRQRRVLGHSRAWHRHYICHGRPGAEKAPKRQESLWEQELSTAEG